MNSRLITGADLETAGFDTLASTWANESGVKPTLDEVTDATFSVPNAVTHFYVMNSATSQLVTLEADLANIPIGGVATFVRRGVGTVTFEAASGVTIESADGLVMTKVPSVAQLLKIGANLWIASGMTT